MGEKNEEQLNGVASELSQRSCCSEFSARQVPTPDDYLSPGLSAWAPSPLVGLSKHEGNRFCEGIYHPSSTVLEYKSLSRQTFLRRLQRLDKLTQEETWAIAAKNLEVTDIIQEGAHVPRYVLIDSLYTC